MPSSLPWHLSRLLPGSDHGAVWLLSGKAPRWMKLVEKCLPLTHLNTLLLPYRWRTVPLFANDRLSYRRRTRFCAPVVSFPGLEKKTCRPASSHAERPPGTTMAASCARVADLAKRTPCLAKPETSAPRGGAAARPRREAAGKMRSREAAISGSEFAAYALALLLLELVGGGGPALQLLCDALQLVHLFRLISTSRSLRSSRGGGGEPGRHAPGTAAGDDSHGTGAGV